MKTTEDDVDILPGCVIIETLNQERDVNKLMYIHEELALKGYLLDGQVCCNGILKLGFTQDRVSAAKFEMTETLMLRKYFEL